MTPSTTEKILENFPHPTIPPIVGRPEYATIAELHLKLNTNAASIHSNQGNEQLGLLYLTVKQDIYDTLSDVPFDVPANPGAEPVIPAGASGPAIVELWCVHKEQVKEFITYTNMDKSLKSQLIATVDEAYIRPKRNKYVGYANVTTKELLEYLYTNYAKITMGDLQENKKKMNKPYDPNKPFEVLIDQIEDAIEFAAAAKCPFTSKQIVTTAYNLVFDTGLFADGCKEWHRKPEEEQTWSAFKKLFV